MTKLEAVNEMIRGLGLAAVASIASGIGLDAKTYLERWTIKIVTEGWHINTENEVELEAADIAFTFTGSPSGTFTYDETLTGTTSSATATYKGEITTAAGTIVYAVVLTGTFTALGETITGGTSTTERAAAVPDAATDDTFIFVDPDMLHADPTNNGTYPDVTLRKCEEGAQQRFYDRDDNTYAFSSSVKVTQIRDMDFLVLPDCMQELIAVESMIDYTQKVKLPVPQDAPKRLARARMNASQDDDDRRDLNLQNSSFFRNVAGIGSVPRRY